MFTDFILYLSHYSFARHILIALILLSILFAALSSLLICKQRVSLADTLSHSFLPALVCAVILKTENPFYFWPALLLSCLIITIWSLYAIEWLERFSIVPSESAIVAVMTFFFSLGLLLMKYSRQSGAFEKILLGDPLSIQSTDCLLLAILVGTILYRLIKHKRSWENWVMDENYAKIQGYPTQNLKNEFILLLGLGMMASLMIVGSLLVLALLVIPGLSIRSRKILDIRIMAMNLGLSLFGFFISYTLDWPLSATIGFLGTSWLMIYTFIQRLIVRH